MREAVPSCACVQLGAARYLAVGTQQRDYRVKREELFHGSPQRAASFG